MRVKDSPRQRPCRRRRQRASDMGCEEGMPRAAGCVGADAAWARPRKRRRCRTEMASWAAGDDCGVQAARHEGGQLCLVCVCVCVGAPRRGENCERATHRKRPKDARESRRIQHRQRKGRLETAQGTECLGAGAETEREWWVG
jgi:hypothetical protein